MEPDIAPLAKRLAEENNVSWQQLNGSGANGKIVERDVLEYLARVMAGEEALNPTPEPVPEGMEAWPEEDTQGFAVQQAAPVSTMVEDPPEDNLLDTDLDDLLDVSDDAFLADFSDDSVGLTSEASDDEDIFLFDDDLGDNLTEEDNSASSLIAEAEVASEEAADDAFAAVEFEDSLEFNLEDDVAAQDDFSLQASEASEEVEDLLFAEDDSAELATDSSENEMNNDLFATDFDDGVDLDEDIASLFNDDSSANAEESPDLASGDSFGTDVLADLLPDDVFSDDFDLTEAVDNAEFEGLEDSFVDLSEDLEADELEAETSGFEAEASAFTDVSEAASADVFLDDSSEEMDDLFDTDLLSEDLSAEDDSFDDLLDDSLGVESEVDTLFQEADEDLFVASKVNDSDLDDNLFAESDVDIAAEEITEDLEVAQEVVSDDLFDDDLLDAVDLSTDEVVETSVVEELSVAEASVEEVEAFEPELETVSVESESLLTEDLLAVDEVSEDLVAEELEVVDVTSDALLTEDAAIEDVVDEEPEIVEAASEEANLESNDIAEEVELEPLPVIAAPVSQEAAPVAAPSVVIRRYIDVASLDQVRAVVAKELKQDSLSYDAFLLRAAAKVFGEKVAVLSINDDGFSAKQGNALSGGLRNTVTALSQAEVLTDLSQLDLVVVDISSFGLDEIVLNAAVPVLSLGRTTVDEAQAKQMTTLALSGDISVAKASKQLAELDDLLSQPLGLIV